MIGTGLLQAFQLRHSISLDTSVSLLVGHLDPKAARSPFLTLDRKGARTARLVLQTRTVGVRTTGPVALASVRFIVRARVVRGSRARVGDLTVFAAHATRLLAASKSTGVSFDIRIVTPGIVPRLRCIVRIWRRGVETPCLRTAPALLGARTGIASLLPRLAQRTTGISARTGVVCIRWNGIHARPSRTGPSRLGTLAGVASVVPSFAHLAAGVGCLGIASVRFASAVAADGEEGEGEQDVQQRSEHENIRGSREQSGIHLATS